MMAPRSFTIDTSCVIHAAQTQAQAEYVNTLVNAALDGDVALYLTNAFDADMTRASAKNLAANLGWLAERPLISRVPGPFRLDYSALDGGDVLSDEHAALVTEIEQIVLPSQYQVGNVRAGNSEFMSQWARKVNDVQHLAAHLMAGNDAFVTTDSDDILRKRNRLHAATGIVVLSLREACVAIDR